MLMNLTSVDLGNVGNVSVRLCYTIQVFSSFTKLLLERASNFSVAHEDDKDKESLEKIKQI